MKSSLHLLLLLFLLSCSNPAENDSFDSKPESMERATSSNTSSEEAPEVSHPVERKLPRFKTVKEMLIAMGDYTLHSKCLEEVENDPQHILVCFDFLLHENKKYIPARIRATIIHVGMQAFAMTAIDRLTITCSPMGTPDGEQGTGRLRDYDQTVTISRKQADKVLSKYLHSQDYDILMERQGPFWTTSDQFDRLFRQDSVVYLDLIK